MIQTVSVIQLIAPLALMGCGGSTEPPVTPTPKFAGMTLKVGAIGDPAMLAGAKRQRGEWTASREGALEFVDQSLNVPEVSSVDVFLFPGERIGDLVDAGSLAVIPKSALMVARPIEDAEPATADQDAEAETSKRPTGPVESFQHNDRARLPRSDRQIR